MCDVLLAVDWYKLKGYHRKKRSRYEIRQILLGRRLSLMKPDNIERITKSDCEKAAKLLFPHYAETAEETRFRIEG
jgi:hypothetical protein